MLDLLTDIALIFSFILAPTYYLWSLWHEHKMEGIICKWRLPDTAVITLVAFSVNLALFILTAIFFSGILGSRTYPEVFTFSADTMRRLALVSGAFLVGLTLIYLGVSRVMYQMISEEGIWIMRFEHFHPFPSRTLYTWKEIRDYYTREDYPVTQYFFILKKKQGNNEKIRLRVPYFAQEKFQRVLLQKLNYNVDIPGDETYFKIPDISGK